MEKTECDYCGEKKMCRRTTTTTNTHGDGKTEEFIHSWQCFECFQKSMKGTRYTDEKLREMFADEKMIGEDWKD